MTGKTETTLVRRFYSRKVLLSVFLLCLLMTDVNLLAASRPKSASEKMGQISALDAQNFDRYWTIESESPDYRLSFLGDTVEIVSPKGMTLWRNEKMSGDVTIEYDACIMDEGKEGDRLSDLNCFWMASDKQCPDDIFARKSWRNGVFVNCYSLQLYYLGYGGNSNKTTRFRRYDGDETAIKEVAKRPAILVEYTDAEHLNRPNQWRHIKLTAHNGRVCYYIDGERLVDYRDPQPLTEGWFGFRTTWSRVRLTNFRYTLHAPADDDRISLNWIEQTVAAAQENIPVSFGVPFAPGKITSGTAFKMEAEGINGLYFPDFRPLAYWPDGSVKWGGFRTPLPIASGYTLYPLKDIKLKLTVPLQVEETERQWIVKNETMTVYLPKNETNSVIDSLSLQGKRMALAATMRCLLDGKEHIGPVTRISLESVSRQTAVFKCEGFHLEDRTLPFVVRLYFSSGTTQIQMQHTLLYDRDPEELPIEGLGIRFGVPMRESLYNRHVAFSGADGEVWSEPVQPLVGRRKLYLNEEEARSAQTDSRRNDTQRKLSLYEQQIHGKRIPERELFSPKYRAYLDQWASWSDFRLSQLNDMSYTLRKRAKDAARTPWIGTFTGTRSSGCAFVGDVAGGLAVALEDFWQSYPSTLEITHATGDEALLTIWMWSPEAEPMDLRHYDTEAHGLDAAYEDVQEGMSTPYGIARTSILRFTPSPGYGGKEHFAHVAERLTESQQLICTPEYLHRQRAFGVWSLPDSTTELGRVVEQRLQHYLDYYRSEVEKRHWYGYWNYGDFMHSFDPVRDEWMYDVGGFAWDNTELASNSMLWYNFLRTGDASTWNMAVAMSRHTSEVDVYHFGPHAGLGTRHNVSHWGCGAKEARISQAAWNRFYYYLSGGDERTGDLMREVRDADTLLYHLDPMRLAQPRHLYPCTAPARLRIGPDWLAYVANWMTEWERTGDVRYRDKILAGMKSISALPHGIFTGPKALGYDPASGVISYEGDTSIQNTNHLLPIMGGFELMPELIALMDCAIGHEKKEQPHDIQIAPIIENWKKTWLNFCADYRYKAETISQNRFRIPRLAAYAYYWYRDPKQRKQAWKELSPKRREQVISTNGAATWSLDAIYMMEVCPPVEADSYSGQ